MTKKKFLRIGFGEHAIFFPLGGTKHLRVSGDCCVTSVNYTVDRSGVVKICVEMMASKEDIKEVNLKEKR